MYAFVAAVVRLDSELPELELGDGLLLELDDELLGLGDELLELDDELLELEDTTCSQPDESALKAEPPLRRTQAIALTKSFPAGAVTVNGACTPGAGFVSSVNRVPSSSSSGFAAFTVTPAPVEFELEYHFTQSR